MDIETNDVDISKLFHWGDKFELSDKYGNPVLTVHMRLVGDAELNRSRVFAIRKSAELRKKLKDINSEEYMAFIQDVEDDGLIDLILMFKVREFTQQASRMIKPKLPKEPKSDADLEDLERYQEEVDTYADRRFKEIAEEVERMSNDARKLLEKESVEWLRKEYKRLLINEFCEQEMVQRFKESCAFYGTFKDADYKVRLFESFEQFDNLPSEIKTQLLDNYSMLEINIDSLKKSLEATP